MKDCANSRTIIIYGINDNTICIKGLGSNAYYNSYSLSKYKGSILLEASLSSLKIHCILDEIWSFSFGPTDMKDPMMNCVLINYPAGISGHPMKAAESWKYTAYVKIEVPLDTTLSLSREFDYDTDDTMMDRYPVETEEKEYNKSHREQDEQ